MDESGRGESNWRVTRIAVIDQTTPGKVEDAASPPAPIRRAPRGAGHFE